MSLTYTERALKEEQQKVFLLRDAVQQVQWRVAMNIKPLDQQAAYNVCKMVLEKTTPKK